MGNMYFRFIIFFLQTNSSYRIILTQMIMLHMLLPKMMAKLHGPLIAMIQVSITLVVTLQVRPLRSTDRAGVEPR